MVLLLTSLLDVEDDPFVAFRTAGDDVGGCRQDVRGLGVSEVGLARGGERHRHDPQRVGGRRASVDVEPSLQVHIQG